ncbi:hypothetical protein B0H13DRAFT_1899360 [Mycena leptocephala]|nr:hypothetical protein B0H13DRAFT_1899360 [Mycena leptocephala]
MSSFPARAQSDAKFDSPFQEELDKQKPLRPEVRPRLRREPALTYNPRKRIVHIREARLLAEHLHIHLLRRTPVVAPHRATCQLPLSSRAHRRVNVNDQFACNNDQWGRADIPRLQQQPRVVQVPRARRKVRARDRESRGGERVPVLWLEDLGRGGEGVDVRWAGVNNPFILNANRRDRDDAPLCGVVFHGGDEAGHEDGRLLCLELRFRRVGRKGVGVVEIYQFDQEAVSLMKALS